MLKPEIINYMKNNSLPNLQQQQNKFKVDIHKIKNVNNSKQFRQYLINYISNKNVDLQHLYNLEPLNLINTLNNLLICLNNKIITDNINTKIINIKQVIQQIKLQNDKQHLVDKTDLGQLLFKIECLYDFENNKTSFQALIIEKKAFFSSQEDLLNPNVPLEYKKELIKNEISRIKTDIKALLIRYKMGYLCINNVIESLKLLMNDNTLYMQDVLEFMRITHN